MGNHTVTHGRAHRAAPGGQAAAGAWQPRLGTVSQIRADATHQALFPAGALYDVRRDWEQDAHDAAQSLAGQLAQNPAVQALTYAIPDGSSRFLRALHARTTTNTIAGVIQEYDAVYANYGSPLASAIQEAVAQEFGLRARSYTYDPAAHAAALRDYAEAIPGLRAVVRQMYDNTQRLLAERGITSVRAYRGLRSNDAPHTGTRARIAAIHTQAAASFTTSPEMAYNYSNSDKPGAIVMGARIPAARILSLPKTGFGLNSQHELVVLGGLDRYTVVPVNKTISGTFDAAVYYDALAKAQ